MQLSTSGSRWAHPISASPDIQSYIDAGATTITLRLVGYDQQSAYDRVVNEVLPAFG